LRDDRRYLMGRGFLEAASQLLCSFARQAPWQPEAGDLHHPVMAPGDVPTAEEVELPGVWLPSPVWFFAQSHALQRHSHM